MPQPANNRGHDTQISGLSSVTDPDRAPTPRPARPPNASNHRVLLQNRSFLGRRQLAVDRAAQLRQSDGGSRRSCRLATAVGHVVPVNDQLPALFVNAETSEQGIMVGVTLSRWICDACGKPIDSAEHGIVVFLRDARLDADHFRIVHKQTAPGYPNCDPQGPTGWVDLPTVLGVDGLTYLLSFLSAGPLKATGGMGVADHDAFVDLVRRVQIPPWRQHQPCGAGSRLSLGVTNP